MVEPGFDLAEWEARWQQLQDGLADATPEETLPEVVTLVEEMLVGRSYQLDEPVTAEGEDADIVRAFSAAREVARLSELDEAEAEDVENALDDLGEIYRYLIADRAAP
jgi:hypothetical protein